MLFYGWLNAFYTTEQWLSWVDDLSHQDYVVIDHFLPIGVYRQVKTLFELKLPEFTRAGIGALAQNRVQHAIRGDQTYWLEPEQEPDIPGFWALVTEMMHILNRYCFLSLSGFEFHFANYPPGASYVKHLDQFQNNNNRVISVVFYLNEQWQPGDGGELALYGVADEPVLLAPLARRAVWFKSAVVPHQVYSSQAHRYSLTGWLLHQPAPLGQLLR